MRWIPLLVLAYVCLVLQTSLCYALRFTAGSAGTVQPDLLALTAAFVAFSAREGLDAMLAGWTLGLAADLTTGATVGVMPIAYTLAAGLIFRVREAFFRDRFSTRMVLTLLFCLVAHGTWVTLQAALAWRWGGYGWVMAQAALVSAYTAVAAPLVQWVLAKTEPLLLGPPAGRARR